MKGVRWRTAADDEGMLRFQANLGTKVFSPAIWSSTCPTADRRHTTAPHPAPTTSSQATTGAVFLGNFQFCP